MNSIKHVDLFSETLWKLFQVSSRSRRRRGDVATIYCILVEGEDLLETKEIQKKLIRRLRDFAARSPPLCDTSAKMLDLLL